MAHWICLIGRILNVCKTSLLFPLFPLFPLFNTYSTIRKMHTKRLDLPAPVRPTTPTFSPAWIVRCRSLRTRSNPSLYRILTWSKRSSPLHGHAGFVSSNPRSLCLVSGASTGRSVYL